MTNNDKVKQLFKGLQDSMVASLGLSAVHDDPNAKGDNSEVSWREMLSSHLPSRYKVGAGIVIDHTGNQSDSIDIIIYDAFYSPYVFNDNGVTYVPAESVYAVIECKQELDKAHIEYSAAKAASVRALKRTSLPISQINGELIAKNDPGILAGVLTTRSGWTPAFGEPFVKAISENANVSCLDFGCTLNAGSFTIDYSEAEPKISTTGQDEALISFFINLVTSLQQLGNAPAIDLRRYYQTISE